MVRAMKNLEDGSRDAKRQDRTPNNDA